MLLNMLAGQVNIYLFIDALITVCLIAWGVILLVFLMLVGVDDDGPIVDESEEYL